MDRRFACLLVVNITITTIGAVAGGTLASPASPTTAGEPVVIRSADDTFYTGAVDA